MDAFDTQKFARALAENETMARMLLAFLRERRDERRATMESAAGEQAVVLRGRCQELTAIIGEIFKER